MRILFYLENFPGYGGIEKVTAVLSRRFRFDGHQIKVVSSRYCFVESQIEDVGRVNWVLLPPGSICSDCNQEIFRRVIEEFKPDVIVFQDSYARVEDLLFAVVAKLPQLNRPKIITVEHNRPMVWDWSNKFDWSAKGIIRRVLFPYRYIRRCIYARNRRRRLYCCSDAYILLTNDFKPLFAKITNIKNLSKLKVIHNPLTLDKAETANGAEKKKLVLFVGALTERKGVDRLLEIWNNVCRDCEDWGFVVVGTGPDQLRLQSMVEAQSIPRVEFVGFVENPSKYYRAASVFMLASSYEGWGLVLTESMSCGCVPIAYDTFEALHDIIDNEDNGFIIQPYNEAVFSKALKCLMMDNARLNRMGCSAIKKAELFSLDNIASQWYTLFKNIMEN